MKRLIAILCLMLCAPAWACDEGACRDEMQLALMNPAVLGAGSAATPNIAFGSGAEGTSAYNGTSCTVTKDLTAGDLVLVYVSVQDTAGSLSVSDNADTPNTYTGLTQKKQTAGVVGHLFYSLITTSKTGATITVSNGVTGGYTRALVVNFTGSWIASPADKDVVAGGYGTSSSANSGVLAQAKELIVVGGLSTSANLTKDADFSRAVSYSVLDYFFIDYMIVSATTSINYTGTFDASESWVLNLGSFEAY